MFRSANHALWPLQTKGLAILQKGVLINGSVVCQRLLPRQGVADDLVFHVRDVHDMVETKSTGMQPAAKQVVKYERSEISNVRKIVDRGAASVHAHGVILRRDKR